MSALILDTGVVAIFWAVLWYLWDHYATQIPWLLGFGAIALLIGLVLP